ncbi:MAG: toprim domain-containing protein, partial [Candidatus Pacearchaeota archaeon]|nr:toprim domain-containing protein [Candidatus Pacearchaeota archaeon]
IEKSKTTGTIKIHKAIDKTETTLVADAIETIERFGPSNAKITIEKIEDVRDNKRYYILEMAKKLLEGMDEKMPKSKEITETIKSESRTSRIKEYGDEKLPCGDIEGNELIIVEGRADVINLLRNGVDNVIGMNGTILPEGIKKLSFEKEVTLFVDGDRGGKLIAKNVIDNARVDFMAFAPDGKEVEELSGKEILVSLRKKISLSDYLKSPGTESYRTRHIEEEPVSNLPEANLTESRDKLSKYMKEVAGTKSVILLGNQLEELSRSNSRNLFIILKKYHPYVLVIDTVNRGVVEAAEDAGVKNIAAKSFTFTNTSINLISL